MIYYIADLHIGHKNAISFDNRPFRDVKQMEKVILNNWNNKVLPNDDVYILGDVFYHYPDNKRQFIMKLSGQLHLIIGNHDRGLLAESPVISLFESVDMIKRIDDNGRVVILCHYPIADWDQKYRGSYHVYGHVHSNVNETTCFMMKQERAINAGCMINGYAPRTLEELEVNKAKFIDDKHIPI